jgi:hypothetical protein
MAPLSFCNPVLVEGRQIEVLVAVGPGLDNGEKVSGRWGSPTARHV